MFDEIAEQFEAGVDAYWRGQVPRNWDNPEKRARAPFLTGWYMVSMEDNQPGWVLDAEGRYPLEEED